MSSKKKVWQARIVERDASGKQRVVWWGGRFATKRERDAAVALAKVTKPWLAKPASEMTGDEVVDAYLADLESKCEQGTRKASTLDTLRSALKPFRRHFGSVAYAAITRADAKAWMPTIPKAYRPVVVVLGNWAVDELELMERNVFRGLGATKQRLSRRDRPLPDLEAVLTAALVVHGEYGPEFAAFILTGALTGMRPGELRELRWGDVDLDNNRVTVSRREYRGSIDLPKNGKVKRIALPPRARDALFAVAAERLTQDPDAARPEALVFLSKQGKPLTAQLLSYYWQPVRATAGLEPGTDFYLATKHWGVNLLWKSGVPTRAIAAQMGWSERGVEELLKVYGHKDEAALEAIDALYAESADERVPA